MASGGRITDGWRPDADFDQCDKSQANFMSRTAPSAINHQWRMGILQPDAEPPLALTAITAVMGLTRAGCWFGSSCGLQRRCLSLCPWGEARRGEAKNPVLSLVSLTPSHSSALALWLPDGGVNINTLGPGGFSGAEYRSARLKSLSQQPQDKKTTLLFALRGNDSQSQVCVTAGASALIRHHWGAR